MHVPLQETCNGFTDNRFVQCQTSYTETHMPHTLSAADCKALVTILDDSSSPQTQGCGNYLKMSFD